MHLCACLLGVHSPSSSKMSPNASIFDQIITISSLHYYEGAACSSCPCWPAGPLTGRPQPPCAYRPAGVGAVGVTHVPRFLQGEERKEQAHLVSLISSFPRAIENRSSVRRALPNVRFKIQLREIIAHQRHQRRCACCIYTHMRFIGYIAIAYLHGNKKRGN